MNDTKFAQTDPTLKRIQSLAISRIRELEKEIFDTYGLRVCCGVELEFYYRTKEGNLPTDQIQPKQHDRSIQPRKSIHNSFINSPYIEAVEKEKGSEKYEIVIGNPSRRKIFPDKNHIGRPAHVIARAAIATKNLIIKRTPEIYDGEARFWPIDKGRSQATAGLHVNISLWDKDGKENLFPRNKKLVKALASTGLDAQEALLPLIIESHDSLERFKRGWQVPHDIQFRTRSKIASLRYLGSSLIYKTFFNKNGQRFEHRIAGADADPALAILQAVGSIYIGLKRDCCVEPPITGKFSYVAITGENTPSLWVNTDIQKPLRRAIPESTHIILDKYVQDESVKQVLGDKLYHEIQCYRRKNISPSRN